MTDAETIYDTLAAQNGWPQNPSLCVGCAPHQPHAAGACSGSAGHALDSCHCAVCSCECHQGLIVHDRYAGEGTCCDKYNEAIAA